MSNCSKFPEHALRRRASGLVIGALMMDQQLATVLGLMLMLSFLVADQYYVKNILPSLLGSDIFQLATTHTSS
ncbi:hypothetical protein NL676_007276 [Syzygium grande]|nr:hypothetical protein NL676_007276 [Syzygium grande]